MKTIAERFLHLRKLAGMSQTEFAKLINLSQGRLSDIEKGKNKPSADTIISIVQKFSIDARWLLMGFGSPPQAVSLQPSLHEPTDALDSLSDIEKELLSNYRILNESNQKMIEKFMRFLNYEQRGSNSAKNLNIFHAQSE